MVRPRDCGLTILRPCRLHSKVHCIKCHGQGGESEGDVNLLALSVDGDLRARPKLLEKLIVVLKDRQMPPEDEPPVPDIRRQRMIAQLQSSLKQALKTQPFEPTPIRRMNRYQYNNAVVDLLELDRDIFQLNERVLRRREDYFRPETKKMPDRVRVSSRPLSKDIDNQRPEGFRGVAAFPQDQRAEHGFDNRADHLTMSPLLMESFLQLSQTIVESPDLNPDECRSWDRLFAPPWKPARGPVDARDEAEQEDVVKTVGAPKGQRASQELSGREQKRSRDSAAVSDIDAIRSRLTKLLRRAFRRPVDLETLDRFTQFAERQLASGVSFEQTMRTVVGAVIGMPDFLYLYESHGGDSGPKVLASGADGRTAAGAVGLEQPVLGRRPVSDFELASRLAQFFWSSIPDDPLLDLAESGKLSLPETLGAQIDRMMNDRRSSRFCDNFPGQWLQLDRLITAFQIGRSLSTSITTDTKPACT